MVNWIEGLTELMCLKNSVSCYQFCIKKVSSTYIFQNLRGFSTGVMGLCSKASMWMLATIGLIGNPMAAPLFAEKLVLE